MDARGRRYERVRVSGSPRAAGFLRRARSRGLAAGDRVRAERELARALVHAPLDGLRGRRDGREGDGRRVVREVVRVRVSGGRRAPWRIQFDSAELRCLAVMRRRKSVLVGERFQAVSIIYMAARLCQF